MAPGSVLFTVYRELQEIYTSLARIEELVEGIGNEINSLQANMVNEREVNNLYYLHGLVDGYGNVYDRLNQILYGAVPGAPDQPQPQEQQADENTDSD